MSEEDYRILNNYMLEDHDPNPFSELVPCALSNMNRSDQESMKTVCLLMSLTLYMIVYFNTIMSIFGIFINSYTIYTFYKSRMLGRQRIYMNALAISNSLSNIIWIWIIIFPAFGLPFVTKGRFSWIFKIKNNFLCTFSYSITYFMNQLSFLLLLFSSIDRCLAIMMPLKSRRWGKGTAYSVIVASLLWNGLNDLPQFWFFSQFYDEKTNKIRCGTNLNYKYDALFSYYHFFFYPFGFVYIILYLIINLKLVFIIIKYSKFRKKLVSGKQKSLLRTSDINACVQVLTLSTTTSAIVLTMKLLYFSIIFAAEDVPTIYMWKIGLFFELLYAAYLNIIFLPLLLKGWTKMSSRSSTHHSSSTNW